MTAEFEPGQRFGAYELGKEIGRGGMGVVYEAKHVHLGRTVALKLLSPELSESPDFRARFLRESRLAATIEHPGIVTIYDAGDVNGVLYLAMRHVQGTDLAAVLKQRGTLGIDETLSILDQVAAALDAAHAAGLVHRDVKPANVMIEGEHCYLTDFGLTKRTDETRALTSAGQFLGTADYVAPEQIEGRELDGRTDVYALGCLLYECLTGSRPFPRDSPVAVLYAQLHDPPPRPSALRPELPAAFDGVVERAMAKAVEGRYPTPAALAVAALHASLAPGAAPGAAPVAAPESPPPPTAAKSFEPTVYSPEPPAVAAPLPPEARTGATQALPPTPRRRLTPAALIALVALLVVGAVVAVVALSGGGGSQPSSPHVVGAALHVSEHPVGLVSNAGFLWVVDTPTGHVIRIKPDGSGRVEIPVGQRPFGLASNSTSVWAANSGDDSVTRIVTSTRETTRLGARAAPLFLTADDKVVYVANSGEGSVSRLDARSGDPIGGPIRVGTKPLAIVTGGGSAWVANRDSGTVSRITGDRVVQTLTLGGKPVGLLYRDGVLWVSNVATDTVTRIDTRTNRSTITKVGRKPYALGYFGSWVWVTNRDDGTVMRLDPDTGRAVGAPIDVPGDPVSMALHDGDLWVAANGAGTLTRIKL